MTKMSYSLLCLYKKSFIILLPRDTIKFSFQKKNIKKSIEIAIKSTSDAFN